MPPISRKRRAIPDDSDDNATNSDSTPAPAPSRSRPGPNRRVSSAHDERNDDEYTSSEQEPEANTTTSRGTRREADAIDNDTPSGAGVDESNNTTTTRQQMVKNLVRLALACEYSRTPVRRADISAKVLGREGRQFRAVFDEAQMALRSTFGMELVELPAREKVTLKERRAAQTQAQTQAQAQTQGAASQASGSSNSWVLRSVLPSKFRTAEILAPPKVPTAEVEAAYVGLYSFVVAVITLNGGVLAEAKLERYLRRTNAEVNTPVERTEKLLQRMIRDGYLVRVKENVSGDEVVEYMVGPRGKMEIGDKGVENLVKSVYGTSQGPAEDEELEKRITRSLKVGAARIQPSRAGGGEQTESGAGQSRARAHEQAQALPRRTRTRRRDGESDDEDGAWR